MLIWILSSPAVLSCCCCQSARCGWFVPDCGVTLAAEKEISYWEWARLLAICLYGNKVAGSCFVGLYSVRNGMGMNSWIWLSLGISVCWLP